MEILDLDRVLAFRPSLRVERIEPDLVFLVGERERFVVSDASTFHVVQFVDGQHDIAAIAEMARGRVSESETLFILSRLVARGHLVAVAPDVSLQAAAFWHGLGRNAGATGGALDRGAASVRCIGDDRLGPWMTAALQQVGVRVETQARFQVVVAHDHLQPELAEIGRRALREGTAWLLVSPTGTRPLVGPWFQPGQGPCWECLAFWMRCNRPVEQWLHEHGKQEDPVLPPKGNLATTIQMVCGFGALATARILASGDDPLVRDLRTRLMALDLISLETTMHAVVRRPQCPACGDPGSMRAVGERPIELRRVEKKHCTDGGYRRQTPRETNERYGHLVSPITGPVTHLVSVPGRDTELRAVYASGYMLHPRNEVPRTNVFDKVCAGKGRSAEQSKASALCEALERWSGVYQGDEARVRASQEELGPAALGLGDLLAFSRAQYQTRSTRADANPRERVSEIVPSTTRIDWTPAWSLTHNERRYVPLGYCYSEVPGDAGAAFCQPCGNGVAAGTCLEEALLQGLLELVERDAAGIWWYNRLCRPEIDLESFGDGYFAALRTDYARLGWRVWTLDLTHDLGIATCVALAHEPNADRFAIGFGCHLDPRLAVQRALTELNQLFDPASTARAPWDHARLSDREFLFPRSDVPAVAAGQMPRIHGDDLRADIEQCMVRLHEAGLELVVVDKTRPDIGLNVLQAIAPGLCHIWPRFGARRLYQVPAALGWAPRPLTEGELNQVPLFV